MLTGQLSYGTGDKNCCPDTTYTTSVQLLALTAQTELDQLQAESLLMDVKVPSLQLSLVFKMPTKKNILENMHEESDLLDNKWANSLAAQLEVQLKSRILINQTDAVVNAR